MIEQPPELHVKWFWHAWPTCFAYACFMSAQFGDEFNRFKHRKSYDPTWVESYYWQWLTSGDV